MKLLFDENILPRLVADLADAFPGPVHVRDVGLDSATDATIWTFTLTHDLTIVSKDSDSHQMSFVRGPAPKVIWVRQGSRTTADIEALSRSNRAGILAFGAEVGPAFLILSKMTADSGSLRVLSLSDAARPPQACC